MFVSLAFNRFGSILPRPSEELAILDLPRARGVRLPKSWAENLTAAVTVVQSVTEQDEAIFVANQRHDMGTINHVLLYFLAERRSATKYWVFEPGLTTTARIQRKIIDDIERDKVPCIVVCIFPDRKEPNKSSTSSGAVDLDVYIQDNFHEVARFGGYAVLLRTPATEEEATMNPQISQIFADSEKKKSQTWTGT